MYDLQDHRPGPVLKAIFSNLDAAAAAGDKQARLLACASLHESRWTPLQDAFVPWKTVQRFSAR